MEQVSLLGGGCKIHVISQDKNTLKIKSAGISRGIDLFIGYDHFDNGFLQKYRVGLGLPSFYKRYEEI